MKCHFSVNFQMFCQSVSQIFKINSMKCTQNCMQGQSLNSSSVRTVTSWEKKPVVVIFDAFLYWINIVKMVLPKEKEKNVPLPIKRKKKILKKIYAHRAENSYCEKHSSLLPKHGTYLKMTGFNYCWHFLVCC